MTRVEESRRLARIAERLQITEGQLYSLAVLSFLVILVVVPGLRGVLDGGMTIAFAPVAEAPQTPTTPAGPKPEVSTAPPTTEPMVPLRDAGNLPSRPAESDPGPDTVVSSGEAPAADDVLAQFNSSPVGIALDGDVVVVALSRNAEAHRDEIRTLTRDGDLITRIPIPLPPSTGLAGVTAAGGRAFAVDGAGGRVLAVDVSTGRVHVLATLPDLPLCALALGEDCEVSVIDGTPDARDIAITDGGVLIVADRGQGAIWRVAATGTTRLLHQSPEYIASGGISAVAVDGKAVFFTTQGGSTSVDSGALYRLPIESESSAAARVTSFEPGDMPRGITRLSQGQLVVALSGAGQVEVVAADGTRGERTPDHGGLEAPSRVAALDDVVFVTTATADGHGAVRILSIPSR